MPSRPFWPLEHVFIVHILFFRIFWHCLVLCFQNKLMMMMMMINFLLFFTYLYIRCQIKWSRLLFNIYRRFTELQHSLLDTWCRCPVLAIAKVSVCQTLRFYQDSRWRRLGQRNLHCPRYLADYVTPAIEVASRHRLRSANRHRLIVPRCRLNTYGRRAFPAAGPTVWNSLPDELRDPACDVDSFKEFFKTILFSSY